MAFTNSQTQDTPINQNTPSDNQSTTDDMLYISPEQGDLLFAQTDPELYAFMKGGAK